MCGEVDSYAPGNQEDGRTLFSGPFDDSACDLAHAALRVVTAFPRNHEADPGQGLVETDVFEHPLTAGKQPRVQKRDQSGSQSASGAAPRQRLQVETQVPPDDLGQVVQSGIESIDVLRCD